MKNQAFQILVPKPCHEDWKNMTPTDKGKFCASCEKEVVDLTQLSDRALIHFFKQKKENTCGRLRPTQLDRNLNHYIKPGPSKSLLYTILFGGLSISQVSGQATVTPPIAGNIEMVEPDSKIALHETSESYIVIKGNVFNEDKASVMAATVVLKNTTIGTVTDFNGKFELKIPKDSLKDMIPILVVSYVGLETKEIKANSTNTLNIKLNFTEVLMGAVCVIDSRPKHEKFLNKIVKNIPLLRFKKRIRKKNKKLKTQKYNTRLQNTKSKHIEQKTIPEKIKTSKRIKVYPNPFNNEVKLTFTAPKNGRYKIEILSIDAKRVFKSNFTLQSGDNTPTITLPSTLPSGQYILFLEGHGVKESEIIIKE